MPLEQLQLNIDLEFFFQVSFSHIVLSFSFLKSKSIFKYLQWRQDDVIINI